MDANKKVLIIGYYDVPSTAQFGFTECNDEIALMRTRSATLASLHEEVYYLNMGEVVSASDLSRYIDDHVHPSEAAAIAIGNLIGNFIGSAE